MPTDARGGNASPAAPDHLRRHRQPFTQTRQPLSRPFEPHLGGRRLGRRGDQSRRKERESRCSHADHRGHPAGGQIRIISRARRVCTERAARVVVVACCRRRAFSATVRGDPAVLARYENAIPRSGSDSGAVTAASSLYVAVRETSGRRYAAGPNGLLDQLEPRGPRSYSSMTIIPREARAYPRAAHSARSEELTSDRQTPTRPTQTAPPPHFVRRRVGARRCA